MSVTVKQIETIKTQLYNNEIIVVLIYNVICDNVSDIKLEQSHVDFDFSNKMADKDLIWYLEELRLQKNVNKKVNYLFSGLNMELGFNNEQSLYLQKDISSDLTITFIASSVEDYDKNDHYVEKLLSHFKNINIRFKNYYLIDKRINKANAKKVIEASDVVFLSGGNPRIQMELINDYSLKEVLQSRNGITIGISAGAMNQAKHVVYKDDCQIFDYEGIGLNDIFIYPHLNTNSIEYLNEILSISKITKLYSLPNDSFVRIVDGKVEFIGNYYELGN